MLPSSRAILAFVTVCLAVTPAVADSRQGWHGELMPEGLRRGSEEGDYVWQRDGSVMVYVPAGSFPMGSADGDRDEQPVHQVELDGYYIDKYEVSWRQWKLTGFTFSEDPHNRKPYPRAPDWGIVDTMPVVNVTWDDARKYAEWAGKRLPTEAEWEKAARGTDGRTYPWGSEPPNFERAIWKDHPTALESMASVDACPDGASPYGVFNMAGNAYEWCEDTYDSKFYKRSPVKNPVNRDEGRFRVLRGGGFVLEISDLRSALRYRLHPEDRTPYIGFRLALSGAASGGEG